MNFLTCFPMIFRAKSACKACFSILLLQGGSAFGGDGVPDAVDALPTIPFNRLGEAVDQQSGLAGTALWATQDGVGLCAAMQDLEGSLTTDGLWLTSTSRENSNVSNRFRVRATELGRGENRVSLPSTGVVQMEGTALAAWSRLPLIEEFSVSTDGVRQDLVISKPPEGRGEVVVVLEVAGAAVEAASYGVKLTVDGSERELAYHRLHVTDAAGKILMARMEVAGPEKVLVRVEDAGAVYPIRVDPTFSDADWVSLNPGLPGANGPVRAMASDGTNLYVGGDFTFIGTVAAQRIAKWDGSSWSSLGSGIAVGTVRALTLIGGELYVGGNFGNAGGVGAINIAKWDGVGWSALGSGMNGFVNAIVVIGTDVYAGGGFGTAGGVAANSVAKWNGAAWAPLGSGTNGEVTALAVMGTNLYAGGSFTTAGGVTANRVAKWNGAGWSPLGSGANDAVDSLLVDGGVLYVGGNFTTIGGRPANRVAKWDGVEWVALSSGMNQRVKAMLLMGGALYAGGEFTTAGGVPATGIARWNGTAWSSVGLGISSWVYSLVGVGSELYAGGNFARAGGLAAQMVARWDGSNWSGTGLGMNGTVKALVVSGSDLYAGGDFSVAGGLDVNYIAKWDGSSWSSLNGGMNYGVNTLAIGASGELYAGGSFTQAGGVAVSRVAKWDGNDWSALDSGVSGEVWALVADGSALYVGGEFSFVGSSSVLMRSVAKWNGSAWSALGGGLNSFSSVRAIAVGAGGEVYVGGDLSVNGANYLAKWDGNTWTAVGSGVSGRVDALAVMGADVFAGGAFFNAGGGAALGIARWNGAAWSALGSGLNNYVSALAVSDKGLLVGGQFTTAGGAPANRVALWDGNAWSPLGSGVNSQVRAIASVPGAAYLGGHFLTAGSTVVSPHVVKAVLAGDSPEISVNGNGQDILDGDGIPNADDHTDFGSVVVTGGAVTRTFTITNVGTADLTLTGGAGGQVSLSGPGTGAFSVSQQPASATVAANGGSATFTIMFDPSITGVFNAEVSIANDDADENPFDFGVSGAGVTSQEQLGSVLAGAGFSGADAAADATPFHDGVENLLKYAFNMNLSGADTSVQLPGGTPGGLPSIGVQGSPEPGSSIFRFEFVRRIGSGLVYTPQKSSSLDSTSWVPLSDTPEVVPIDGFWERLIYEEPVDTAAEAQCFGRVKVTLP